MLINVYRTAQDAVDAAINTAKWHARIAFVSVTPWGAYEVSTHSIALNFPQYRMRRIMGTSGVVTTTVTSWRRN